MSTIMKNGKAVATSRNLRGILDYARKHGVIRVATQKDPANTYRGLLYVTFADSATCVDSWACYEIMIDWVRGREKHAFAGAHIVHPDGDFGYLTAPGQIAGPVTDAQIRLIAESYIHAALWADCPEGTHPRASKEAVKVAEKAVRWFCYDNNADIRALLETEGYGDTCAQDFGGLRAKDWPFAALGHDLYLSSQGHGVGFFDRGLGELGDRLQKSANKYDSRGKAWSVEPDFYRGWMNLR